MVWFLWGPFGATPDESHVQREEYGWKHDSEAALREPTYTANTYTQTPNLKMHSWELLFLN